MLVVSRWLWSEYGFVPIGPPAETVPPPIPEFIDDGWAAVNAVGVRNPPPLNRESTILPCGTNGDDVPILPKADGPICCGWSEYGRVGAPTTLGLGTFLICCISWASSFEIIGERLARDCNAEYKIWKVSPLKGLFCTTPGHLRFRNWQRCCANCS